ncbi:hypothetical protein [Nisaea sediminum]|uniref:hypothetical protein n=1 Tax=Nisaea sediminum TaxID=2775867 RepID=UPI0018681F35|nr:hypothetical protein [Nisaea sediminum]
MKYRTVFCALALLFLMLPGFAEADPAYRFGCGTPSAPDGDAIPTPEGNVGYASMPGSLCGGTSLYTWDYMGTVEDADAKAYSIEATISQFWRLLQDCPADTTCEEGGLAFHNFLFAFEQGGDHFLLNSAYGGDGMAPLAILFSIDTIAAEAGLDGITVQTTPVIEGLLGVLLAGKSNPRIPGAEPLLGMSVKTTGRQPNNRIYLGYTGQPGQQYELSGGNIGFLRRYDGNGAPAQEIYYFRYKIGVEDERGVVGQGLGNGYVGPGLTPGSGAPAHYSTEYEISQARLKVLSWSVEMYALGLNDRPAPGFAESYSFSGKTGMMWNDFGPLKAHQVSASGTMAELRKLDEGDLVRLGLKTEDAARAKARVLDALGSPAPGTPDSSSTVLYHGNWLPVQFTAGKYAGASLVTSVFWLKDTERPKDQTSDNFKDWARIGWGSLYPGILADDVTSSYSLSEGMVPQLPVEMTEAAYQKFVTQGWRNPFAIHLEDFVPEKYDPSFPWVQKLTVTVRKQSRMHSALESYAREAAILSGQSFQATDGDIVITLKALSPVTQYTLFSTKIAHPFYEGAAGAYIDDIFVGYAWIEHMASSPKK